MKNLNITGSIKNIIYPLTTFVLLLLGWELSVRFLGVPSYVLPGPVDIFREFGEDYQMLFYHSKITLVESVVGLFISVVFSFVVCIIMDFVPFIKKCFYPILYITQMIPTITLAPLLIIWFGFGIKSKVLCVILTCFFPILINLLDGIDSIDKDFVSLFKIMKSSRLKTFVHLKLPMSMDKFFTGLKISSAYAFIAATVAEWLGGNAGLGVYMVRAKSSYALDKVFACTILIILFSLVFVAFTTALKRIFIRHN